MHRLICAEQYVPVRISGKRSPFTTAAPIPKKYEAKLYSFAPAFMDRSAECDILYQSLMIDSWVAHSYQLCAREDHTLELSVEEPFFILHFSMNSYIDLEMSDGTGYRLLPGQYRLIHFNAGHHYIKCKGGRWYESFFIDCPLSWTTEIATKSAVLQWLVTKMKENRNAVIPFASKIMDDQIYELVSKVRNRHSTKDPISLAHAMAQILDLALYAIGQLPPSSLSVSMDPPSLISTIKTFMTNNISRLSSVEENAANFGYSVRYFQQFFKNSTGETIRSFMIRTKMEKAQQLLSRPGNSIKVIAARLGYQHPGNFSREYKNFFKHSPRPGSNSNQTDSENDNQH